MTAVSQGVREHPILFSAEMVRATIDGRKSQTRRVLKVQPSSDYSRLEVGFYHPTVIVRGEEEPGEETFGAWSTDGEFGIRCPYGQPGDRLWVREAWCKGYYIGGGQVTVIPFHGCEEFRKAFYLADGRDPPDGPQRRWSPSIHMPRWASRLTLEITEVRVQRVQEIRHEDMPAEGVDDWDGLDRVRKCSFQRLRARFQALWDTLNAKRGYSWESNPFVWAIGFRVRGGVPGDQP